MLGKLPSVLFEAAMAISVDGVKSNNHALTLIRILRRLLEWSLSATFSPALRLIRKSLY